MRCIMLHSICLAPAIRVDEFSDNQRIVGNTVRLGDCERISLHSLDRSPDIDDLHSRLEKLIGIVRKVEGHPRKCSIVGLVDVHALYGSTQLSASRGVARRLTTDGVVEDMDACGASACSSQVCSVEATLMIMFTYASFKSCSTSL